ncbi:MAG: DcuS/MalK family sensor histidine kinase [Bacillus sp. (in: firmicutes)]
MVRNSFRSERKTLKLHTLILLLVFGIILTSILITSIFVSLYVSNQTKENLSEKIRDIARLTAHSQTVIDGLQKDYIDLGLQEYANEMIRQTDVGFIVVLNMDLIRYTHPLETEIGQSFYNREDAQAALKGKEYYSTEEGPLGIGLRFFTPVKNEDGKQIGIVVVGISFDTVKGLMKESRHVVYLCAILPLVLGGVGAFILSKFIKRKLLNMEPEEIAQLLEERNTMIEAVKEGILAANVNGDITLVNQEALKLMNISEERIVDQPIKEYMPIFEKVMETGQAEVGYEETLYGRTVLLNCFPIIVNGEIVGGIGTFRDKTEMRLMAEQLTGVKLYSESLRAHSHEFMNKLHVILGLIHLKKYDALNHYVQDLVEDHESEKNFVLQRIQNPVLAGFLLGKMSKAREHGIQFGISENSQFTDELEEKEIHDLICISGNLIENAFDALNGMETKQVSFSIYPSDDILVLQVKDSGAGIESERLENIFTKGFSTKGEDRGYGLYLTMQSIANLHGKIDIQTNLGMGTIFTVQIPLSKKKKLPEELKGE